jgi:putative transposase
MLDERKTTYDRLKNDKNALRASKHTTEKQFKERFPFLKNVDAIALQQARIDLQRAYTNFFEKRAGYPRFKSKHGHQSYRTINVNDNVRIDFVHRKLRLPKLGWISCRDGHRTFNERISSVTVSKTKAGRWFASMLVKQEVTMNEMPQVHESKIAAFDMSAKEVLVSGEQRFENPRFYRDNERRLKRLHRGVSRKVKCSVNRDEARRRLARWYEKIGNRRTDWLQKLSTSIANDHEVVILEDLNIDGMRRWNGGLAKSVTLDFSWGEFTRMLGYKMAWRGKYLVKVDRFYPSSKTCSKCGFVNRGLTLNDREWTCPSCDTVHDRDVNAGNNLKKEGMRILVERGIKVIKTDSTVGITGNDARGNRARPVITTAAVDEPGIHVL